jgi:hypothetical protein
LTSEKQPKTELHGRTLWADGISVVTPDQVEAALTAGIPLSSLAVTELNDELRKLNKFSDHKLLIKTGLSKSFPPEWSFPKEYKYLELNNYVLKLADRVKRDELYELRLTRLADEYELFLAHDLGNVLRALIYIIDELRKNKIVWGVGRGSSCSSYLLYLIGLHAVDPVRFEIPITDFIR